MQPDVSMQAEERKEKKNKFRPHMDRTPYRRGTEASGNRFCSRARRPGSPWILRCPPHTIPIHGIFDESLAALEEPETGQNRSVLRDDEICGGQGGRGYRDGIRFSAETI